MTEKGEKQMRSARSINGHLASRWSNKPWPRVRDHVLSLLPVALQDTLRREIDLMDANWDTPFLPNDAFIMRKSQPEDLPEPDEGVPRAKELLSSYLSSRIDGSEGILEVMMRRTKHMRANAMYEFLVRSMPVNERVTFIAWLADWRACKRRKKQ